jgi:hypothetical protein
MKHFRGKKLIGNSYLKTERQKTKVNKNWEN